MSLGTKNARERTAALRAELGTLRAVRPYDLGPAITLLRDLVEVDIVGFLTFAPEASSVVVDHAGSTLDDCHQASEAVRSGFNALSPEERLRVFHWDPLRPAAVDRNKVFTGADVERIVGRSHRENKGWQLLSDAGVSSRDLVRVVLCEGGRALAILVALSPTDVRPEQGRRLATLVDPLRERFCVEERLDTSGWARAAVDMVLEETGAAAFIVNDAGAVLHANAVGRAEIERDSRGVRDDLVTSLKGGSAHHLVRLESPTAPLFLAMNRDAVDVAARVAHWIERLELAPQGAAVLQLLARGESSKGIAIELGIAVRTAEWHVDGLLERLGVPTRAALVAKLLGP